MSRRQDPEAKRPRAAKPARRAGRGDAWAPAEVFEALDRENSGSASARKGAITGRVIRGYLRRGGQAT